MNLRQWLPYGAPRAGSRLRVFAFAGAGGSATSFREWVKAAGADLELCPVQLPGRGMRLGERPFTHASEIIPELTSVLRPLSDYPYVLLGHSFGAHLAFWLARTLEELGHAPALVVPLASPAPSSRPPHPDVYRWPDARLVEYLRSLGATSHLLLEDGEMRRMILSVMRADLELYDTLRALPESAIHTPIVAFSGSRDAETGPTCMQQWRTRTRAGFELVVVDGDHFFPERKDAMARVLREIARHVQSANVG